MTAIARRYGLHQIITWTYDRQRRQRILFWGSNDREAETAKMLSEAIAAHAGWPPETDLSTTNERRLKARVKDLETEFARIIERDGDPVTIARAAIKAVDES